MVSRHLRRLTVPAAFTVVLFFTVPASAQLTGSVYVSGLSLPVGFVQDPGNPAVQYVVQQGGRIRVISNGTLQTTDFLDLSASISAGGERGLLGLAFAPDYASSRRFFVFFTSPFGDLVISRFLRSTTNALVADPTSRFDLRWPGGQRFIPHPDFSNHNGGHLVFGPDGYLYIGTGDGGSSDDPNHNAQNPYSLLGKILRVSVNVPDSDADGYDVPSDNPFLGGVPVAALGEIWAFGLRNPWQFSFDDPARGGTGALVIGDVGQNAQEEIDYEPPNRGGQNYGWRNREGTLDNVTSEPPAYLPLIDPIFTFGRTNARSITGGFVYRGSALGPSFRGRYLFGDFITSRVWSFALTLDGAGTATPSDLREHTAELGGTTVFGGISAFGTDANGELYVVCYGTGRILRIGSVTSPATSNPAMVLDLPANNTRVAPVFLVSGWAIDRGASGGAGVDVVHVYAYPQSGAPIFLGSAVLGDARPDVAAIFGASFQAAGFHLIGSGLRAGAYTIVAFARSTLTGLFSIARTAAVVVEPGARTFIDTPRAGTVLQPFVLAGWALDLAATSGTGVDLVHVYAYPVPAPAAVPPPPPPIFVGAARYGDARPDVGQVFGAAFTNSGFALAISGLPPGSYQLVAYAHSTVTGGFDPRVVSVTVASGERMALDVPAADASVGSSFTVAGWALDASAASGTGVDVVHVWAYPSSGAPIFLGSATYGGSRPDVAAIFGARFENSGYGLSVTTNLAPGVYTLVVYARSTVTGGFSNAVTRVVTRR